MCIWSLWCSHSCSVHFNWTKIASQASGVPPSLILLSAPLSTILGMVRAIGLTAFNKNFYCLYISFEYKNRRWMTYWGILVTTLPLVSLHFWVKYASRQIMMSALECIRVNKWSTICKLYLYRIVIMMFWSTKTCRTVLFKIFSWPHLNIFWWISCILMNYISQQTEIYGAPMRPHTWSLVWPICGE